MLMRQYFLPLRGKTESILNFKDPISGMLLLSVDSCKFYAYLNDKWRIMNQVELAFEYSYWGFVLPKRIGKYCPIYLTSVVRNSSRFMPLILRHGKHKHHVKYIGCKFEITYDDDLSQLYIHDGVTPGGKLL